ncbi:unnamed protein product [Arabis nemorensis]|uniref:Uncharacterized protein n=1 Tax=Arabis nemorensis TaxID=586526 RepID=A0A565CGK0_9BRAS|nr:unnamed protein product [Arabis nemorensis]
MVSKFSIGSFVISLAIVLMMVRVLNRKELQRGHTAEMLSLLSVNRKDRFTPRFYIAAATDNTSL